MRSFLLLLAGALPGSILAPFVGRRLWAGGSLVFNGHQGAMIRARDSAFLGGYRGNSGSLAERQAIRESYRRARKPLTELSPWFE